MNKTKLTLRLIVSPFILCILIITYAIACAKHFRLFVLHGGEWIIYNKEDQKRVVDIYNLLKEKQ